VRVREELLIAEAAAALAGAETEAGGNA